MNWKLVSTILGVILAVCALVKIGMTLHSSYDNTAIAQELQQLKQEQNIDELRLDQKIRSDQRQQAQQQIFQIKRELRNSDIPQKQRDDLEEDLEKAQTEYNDAQKELERINIDINSKK
jgi:hypothetical protein